MKPASEIHKIAFLGDYLSRKCGIATFTSDVLSAVAAEHPQCECFAVPMNDLKGGYEYPDVVRFEIEEQDLPSYQRAADFLKLAEINKDLDQLAAKIEKASDAAKAEAKPKLQALRDQTAKLAKQLDEAKNATESTWGDVKASFKKGYGELKDGFNQARQWVSDMMAP